jgi:DoxX-like family
MILRLPPLWLIQIAVSAVWLYEGLWCKLLQRDLRESQVIAAVPRVARARVPLLRLLGVAEGMLALWVLSGIAPGLCAVVQILLLVSLNAGGLLWARHIIADPGGMVVKNFAFLALVWVLAGQSGGILR